MNILLLALDIDLRNQRGDAIHTRELARALAARGHRVDLVTATGPKEAPDLGSGVHLHARPDDGNVRTVRTCARIARQARSEVVYERRLSPKIAYSVSRLLGTPFVVEVNGIEEEAAMLGHAAKPSPLSPAKRRVRLAMFRRAARVVAVTRTLADFTQSRYRLAEDRVVVVPNGVDTERFRPMDVAAARRGLGWPDRPWVAFVGNLVPWQGIETLLRATAKMRGEGRPAHVAVVGDGMLRDALERLAVELGLGPRVTFTGPVPYEEVPARIGAATVCAAPFTRIRNEAIGLSPLKVYEYLACGRPVVASDLPGVRDVVRDSGAGLLVPPDDEAALAEALEGPLADPREAADMGRRGREYAVADCTWAMTAERVERVLQDALLPA